MNMNKTTENFLTAISQYKPPTPTPVVWRLCYEPTTGLIIGLTTENTELNYIEISRDEADQNPQHDPYARVIDGELIYIRKQAKNKYVHKIGVYKNKNGKVVSDAYNMLLLNKHGPNRWYYE